MAAHLVHDHGLDQLINGQDHHHHHHHFERRRSSSSLKTGQNDDENSVVSQSSPSSSKSEEKKGGLAAPPAPVPEKASTSEAEDNRRERLKRHRIEVAGRVWIPEIWGQEDLLKDWIDCNAFDACLVPNGIISARASLVEEGRRAASGRLRIENRC
ncbi:hypothetical protein PanWU01x14_281860 [Parasponia andersonii]|uniref:Uncharacterized protein n=1 Tax=Parasponia andersonii TaxID=3476 RepID=A0A2P5B0U8_PARAD|nr:hypothetical protein PanWU01x14_281860 [Parasponia andersonii]